MEKPTRTAEQLRAMIQVRLNTLLGSGPSVPIAGTPKVRPRDVVGRNWDVDELRNGLGHVLAFRLIVDELRLEYDLGPEGRLQRSQSAQGGRGGAG